MLNKLGVFISLFLFFISSNSLPQQTGKKISYVPTNYTEQYPRIQVQRDQIQRSAYCPTGNYFAYQFSQELHCFYQRRLIGNYPSKKICLANNTQKASSIRYGPNGNIFLLGTGRGNLYIWKVTNCQINDEAFAYSHLMNNSYYNIYYIEISKQDRLLIGFYTKFQILNIPQNGTTLEVWATIDFRNYTQKVEKNSNHRAYTKINQLETDRLVGDDLPYVAALKWHTVDEYIVFIGTQGNGYGNDGFWIYNSLTDDLNRLSNKSCMSIAVFNDGNTVLKGGWFNNQGFQDNYTIDQYSYLNETLTFQSILVKNISAYVMKLSSDNNILWTQGYLADGNVTIYKINKKQNANLQNSQYSSKLIIQTGSYIESAAFSLNKNQYLTVNYSDGKQFQRFSLCKDGNYYQDFECFECTEPCSTCINQTFCTSCNFDRYLANDSCFKCSQILDGCLTCSDKGNCITCNNTLHFKGDSVEGKCICEQNYTISNHACILCEITGCKTCEIQNACHQCKQETGFNPVPNENGTCSCTNQKFLNQTGKQCELCSSSLIGCIKCQNSSECQKCSQNSGFLPDPLQNGTCICPDSSFLDFENKICVKCSESQKMCTKCDDRDTCTQCNENSTLNKETHKCECLTQLVNVSDTCQKCSNLITQCVHCSREDKNIFTQNSCYYSYKDQRIVCSECVQSFTLSDDKTKCECTGQFQVDQNNKCVEKKPQQNNNELYFIIGSGVGVLVFAGIITGCICWRRKLKMKNKIQEQSFIQENHSDIRHSLVRDRKSNISEQRLIIEKQRQSFRGKQKRLSNSFLKPERQKSFVFQQNLIRQEIEQPYEIEGKISDQMLARIGKPQNLKGSFLKRSLIRKQQNQQIHPVNRRSEYVRFKNEVERIKQDQIMKNQQKQKQAQKIDKYRSERSQITQIIYEKKQGREGKINMLRKQKSNSEIMKIHQKNQVKQKVKQSFQGEKQKYLTKDNSTENQKDFKILKDLNNNQLKKETNKQTQDSNLLQKDNIANEDI